MSMCTTPILKQMYECVYEDVFYTNTQVNVCMYIFVCVLHKYANKCVNTYEFVYYIFYANTQVDP